MNFISDWWTGVMIRHAQRSLSKSKRLSRTVEIFKQPLGEDSYIGAHASDMFEIARAIPKAINNGWLTQADFAALEYKDSSEFIHLGGIDLSGAELHEANLQRARLYCTNLHKANLSGANLSDANLTKANLSGANLNGVNLRGADLLWADLSRADLRGADLSAAYLGAAYLRGADLSEANLHGAYLHEAIYEHSTKFPEDFDPEAAGMVLYEL